MQRLEDKVAIVTGAGRGIGREIALGLADNGADVVVTSRTVSELEEVASEIETRGRQALVIPADVLNLSDIEKVVQQTINSFGRIDILINNAGITKKSAAEDYPMEDWNRILGVNLTSVFAFAQLAGRQMIHQGGGSIINISSIASQTAITQSVAYCVSKGGVMQMTKVLAVEWAKYGVRVNAVGPAYITTSLVQAITDQNESFKSRVEARTPMGRMGKPKEVVGAIVFLSSDEASYITGETIFVDGGWLAYGV